MPNPATIAVAHGTPEVTSNFNPVDRTGNLTTFRGETTGPIVGAPRLFVSVKRPSASESNYKVKIRYESPISVTDSEGVARVVRTNRWNTEISVHKDSTVAEIKELAEVALAALSTTELKQVVENLEGFF
jgi:adenylate cyclase class IV